MRGRLAPDTLDPASSPLMNAADEKPGVLWVVATPIGNLNDFPPRAREVLEQCDVIAAEDTRHSGRLLKHFGITTKQVSVHEHNEEKRVPYLIKRLAAGESVALVSDGGTPLISDPGFRLVRAAREAGIGVFPVPGPCAAVAALSVAGLPTDRFWFEGFLPAKAMARNHRLEALRMLTGTLVFYETPQRVLKTLEAMGDVLGADREAVVCRELTKLHETTLVGTLSSLRRQIAGDEEQLRGEMVLVVAGASEAGDPALKLDEGRKLFDLLSRELPAARAAKLAAAWTGCRKRDLYE